MAATPEAKVKAKIKAALRTHNIYYAMPIGTGYGNSGVPDFLCCIRIIGDYMVFVILCCRANVFC